MRRYAWYCTVCAEVIYSETCPKCPDTLALRVYYDDEDKHPGWRTLS